MKGETRDQVVPLGWIWWFFSLSRHALSTLTWNNQWWALLACQRAAEANWQVENGMSADGKTISTKGRLSSRQTETNLSHHVKVNTSFSCFTKSLWFRCNWCCPITIWFFFHFENGLNRRLFGLMMCDHFFSFNLFQVFQLARPLYCSLSAMLLVSRVFLNSPMWLLMWQPQSEALPLLTVRIIKLIASIRASHSPSYSALTTPPSPLCTGRKQNNRMTHRWRELPVRWPCGETEWI